MKKKLSNFVFSALASLVMASGIAIGTGPNALAMPECSVNSDLGGKLNLPIYNWHDDAVPTNGYVVAVHGLTFYASAYDSLANNLASKGFQFYAADMRGFGRWKTETSKFGADDQIHFSQSEEDLRKICETLRAEHPGVPVYVLGESLGANLAFWLASNHSDLVDGVIVSAPCFKADMHPRPRWAVDFVRGLSHPNKPLDLTAYITPYLSNDRKLTQDCLKDQKICRKLTPVELFKAARTNKDGVANLGQIPKDMPVLMLAGKLDKVMHTSAIPKALPKIGSTQVTVHVLPNRGHLLLEHQTVDNNIAKMVDGWLADANSGAVAKLAEQRSKSKVADAEIVTDLSTIAQSTLK